MISLKKSNFKRKELKRIAADYIVINDFSKGKMGYTEDSPFFKNTKSFRLADVKYFNPVKRGVQKHLPNPIRKIRGTFRCRFRASVTVEAALVTHLFVFALTVLISLITVTGVQMRVREAVYESVRSASALPYTLGRSADNSNAAFTKTAALAAVKGFFCNEISEHTTALRVIEGGAGGVDLSADFFSTEAAAISITAGYKAKLPLAFFSGGSIPVKQEIETYAWLGDEFTDSGSTEKMVYITPHGTVYHEDINCTHLRPSVSSKSYSQIGSLRNNGGERYRECEACTKRLGITPSVVYITKYGNRYHTNPNCVKIKHEVITVPLSSVSDRRKCLKE